jgi:3-ketosteroid 9alpha-monooxygenase subunit B
VEFHELRVARVVQETADARSFVLEVPAPAAARFAYRAGQFLTFRVPWGGGALLRCYSLSSCPDTDPALQVTVKRVADGRVSNWFHDALSEGDRLRVTPPAGRFVLREGTRTLALFGGGSGITPLLSLAKSALATTRRRVRLFYANRDADSVIFRTRLAELAAQHPGRLAVHHHLDAERGLLDAAGARAASAGAADADCYLCGPAPFMALLEAALGAAGVPRERVWIERFVSPPDGAVPAAFEAARSDGGAPAAFEAAPPEAGAAPAEVVVHLGGRAHRVPWRAGQSLLEAARAAGLDPPFACQEGYCGTCAARILRGRVEMAANEVFSEAEVAEGHVLTCQARPVGGGCEVRYDD